MTGPKNHQTKVSQKNITPSYLTFSPQGSSREEHLGLSLRQADLHEHGRGQGARSSRPRGLVSNIRIILGDLFKDIFNISHTKTLMALLIKVNRWRRADRACGGRQRRGSSMFMIITSVNLTGS